MPRKRQHAPDVCVSRLPLYLCELQALIKEGYETVPSHLLAERLNMSAAQVRKDLNHFGDFGKQGTGYQAAHLHLALRRILNMHHAWSVVLVGAGRLGRALLDSDYLREQGFHIDAVFDNDWSKVGETFGYHHIEHVNRMTHTIQAFDSRIAIIATPALGAQRVADRLIHAGIRCILNYAPVALSAPEPVRIQNMDPVLRLQHMAYYLDTPAHFTHTAPRAGTRKPRRRAKAAALALDGNRTTTPDGATGEVHAAENTSLWAVAP